FSALLALSTVGPSSPPSNEHLPPQARAALIPLMLLGAMIFSRAMWAIVDVLSPPAAGGGLATAFSAGPPMPAAANQTPDREAGGGATVASSCPVGVAKATGA
ncbi:unnamed protein product, partial [Ectocarpus sp. 8 AP-2014]